VNTFKKPLLVVVAVGITLVLGVEYLRALSPAQAREAQAACRGLRPSGQNRALGALPTKAPDFSAQDHTGKQVSLSEFRGKVVMLRFWASWCETCKAEQPSLEDLAGGAMPDDLVVLNLASDDDWELVRKKLPGGSNTRVLLDPPEEGAVGAVATAYGVQKVPETILIDRDGIVRYYLINKRDWRGSVARTCLRSLLEE
jgi:peroxiredoxin